MKFKHGDEVYTQDGTVYSFSHNVDNYAFVAPFVLIQSTNYSGDGFEEHYEIADHLVRFKLSSISKKPWARKIHKETADAVAAKKAELDEVNSAIGVARTELRMQEKALGDRVKELLQEHAALERRYNFMRELRLLTREQETPMLDMSGDIPRQIDEPSALCLRLKEDMISYEIVARYRYDDDSAVRTFANQNMLEAEVRSMFASTTLTVDDEIKWVRAHPFLETYLSTNAKQTIAETEAEAAAHRMEVAKERLQEAQRLVDKLEAG